MQTIIVDNNIPVYVYSYCITHIHKHVHWGAVKYFVTMPLRFIFEHSMQLLGI